VSSTCFEHPRVHPQEDMQFYGISFIYPYKQSGQWQILNSCLLTWWQVEFNIKWGKI